MASVHPMVTVQAFNGLELVMVGTRFIVCITQEWVGLVAYDGWGHVRLEGTRTPGEDMHS